MIFNSLIIGNAIAHHLSDVNGKPTKKGKLFLKLSPKSAKKKY